MSSTRVLIVDNSVLVRTGLKALLTLKDDITVVGEAEDGMQALEMIENARPDVILMDIKMPLMDGVETTKEIRRRFKNIKVIMMTNAGSDEEIIAALTSGADGYCLKEVDFLRLYNAINCVASGEFWLDSAIAKQVVEALMSTIGPGNLPATQDDAEIEKSSDDETLSSRELEVLALVAQGLSNSKIGARLNLSSETVKTHIRHIMKKLLVSDRTEAAVKALRQGLI